MLFNSFVFLHFFLPIFLVFYFTFKSRRNQNLVLLVFSLFFYSWGEGIVVLLLLLSAVVDFAAAKLINIGFKKIGLCISLVFNLGILFFFKYINFFIENINNIFNLSWDFIDISLPIGISFFTFQTMSYSIDVYRGKVKASNNFLNFASYVCMFPQLIAGPIVRYQDVEKELVSRIISWDKISEGVERFVIGLAKKMILANYFALIADDVFNSNVNNLGFYDSWLGIFAYTMQIFFDFSAYSDMAIGLGMILGFTFPENFKYPYISRSIKEFWRRWHITMSSWFKDYLYISLGGNRVSNFRIYVNLFVVFIATGLWHGASWNFIVWGLIHGFVIVFERLFPSFFSWLPSIVRWFYTMLVVMIAWVFFRADNIDVAMVYLSKMCAFEFELTDFFRIYFIDLKFVIISSLGILICTPFLWDKGLNYLRAKESVFRYLYMIFIGFLFLLSLSYIATSSYDPFIYFRF